MLWDCHISLFDPRLFGNCEIQFGGQCLPQGMRTRIYSMAAIDYLICPKKVWLDSSVEIDVMRAGPYFHNREQGGQSDIAVSDNRSSSTVQREHEVRQLHVCCMHLRSQYISQFDILFPVCYFVPSTILSLPLSPVTFDRRSHAVPKTRQAGNAVHALQVESVQGGQYELMMIL